MIEGHFNDLGQIYFDLKLITPDEPIAIDAMFDTGFTGFIAVNKQDLDGLDWSFIREQPMRTARGESIFHIYLGEVRLDEKTFSIPVHAGDEIQEILLGSEWLKEFDLIARYRQEELKLE